MGALEEKAKLKQRLGSSLQRSVASSVPKLWSVFKDRCLTNGQKPGDVLPEGVFRCFEDEDFASEILGYTVDVNLLEKRKFDPKDIEEYIQFKERIRGEKPSLKDLVTKLVVESIEKETSTPLDRLLKKGEKVPEREVQRESVGLEDLSIEELGLLEEQIKEIRARKNLEVLGVGGEEEGTGGVSESGGESGYSGEEDTGE